LFLLLAVMLAPMGAADIPRPAKDLKFKLATGEEVSLSKYKGQIVVLEFLLTTCSHCQEFSRSMEKVSKEFEGKGVQMLGVAINEGASKLVGEYVKQLNLHFPVGYIENKQTPLEFLQHPIMARMMMPQLVFIDRVGVIQAQFEGSDQKFFTGEEQHLREMIQKMLGKAAPAKPAAKKAPAKK
jgi:peroxiredoxin